MIRTLTLSIKGDGKSQDLCEEIWDATPKICTPIVISDESRHHHKICQIYAHEKQ